MAIHVAVEPQKQRVVLHIPFLDQLAAAGSVRSEWVIPFAQIKRVRLRPDEASQCFIIGFRQGTCLPGVFTAATFYHRKGKRDFYYVKDPLRTIGLDLQDHPTHARVIIEVQNTILPEEVADMITRGMRNALIVDTH
ncbi:hypothetical protein DFS34DRAFT_63129 [Phlyctochytrium arcticum]|nr:hypothetical protein DFS34DRAFT_63129 [Phlyctochytrium arcticum]